MKRRGFLKLLGGGSLIPFVKDSADTDEILEELKKTKKELERFKLKPQDPHPFRDISSTATSLFVTSSSSYSALSTYLYHHD